LKAEELIGLDNETVLHRLFHQEELRLFDAQPVRFECSCSADRSGNALVSLGKDDVLALLQEQGGCIEIDCQFCNARYPFNADAIESLFAAADEHARQLH